MPCYALQSIVALSTLFQSPSISESHGALLGVAEGELMCLCKEVPLSMAPPIFHFLNTKDVMYMKAIVGIAV